MLMKNAKTSKNNTLDYCTLQFQESMSSDISIQTFIQNTALNRSSEAFEVKQNYTHFRILHLKISENH